MINRAICVFCYTRNELLRGTHVRNNTLRQLICYPLSTKPPLIGRNQCICETTFLNLTAKNNLAFITENEFMIQTEISVQILNAAQKGHSR